MNMLFFSQCLAEHDIAALCAPVFNLVEVGLAKSDCQTVNVLLCLFCLVLLVYIASLLLDE